MARNHQLILTDDFNALRHPQLVIHAGCVPVRYILRQTELDGGQA